MRFSECHTGGRSVVHPLSAYAGGAKDGVSGSPPEPEVTPRPRRRFFSAAYKAALLAELDECPGGEIGAILRREGVYSSSVAVWRKQRRAGQLAAAKRGPKPLVPVQPSLENGEAQQLRRENRRLKRELETAHLIIDIQKKAAMLLGISMNDDESSLD